MGLDLGILVKLTQFLIIMILCLIFVEFSQWRKGIFGSLRNAQFC